MLMDAVRYRFDGKLFKWSKLQTKSTLQKEMFAKFLFADDMGTEMLRQKQSF